MKERNNRIPLFLAVVAMFWFSLYTYSPIFTVYIKEFSTTQMAGTIIASYGFVQMCLRIPVGILSDRLKNRKTFVSLGIAVSGLAALGMATCRNPYLMLFFRGITGFTAATWVPFSILYSSYYKNNNAAKAIGMANAFNFGGQMIATLIGGFLPDWFGSYAPSFYLAVAVAAAGLILSFFIVDQDKSDFPEQPARIIDLLKVIKDPMLMIASGLAILTQFCSFATVYGFTPTFAQANVGATSSQLGIMTTLVTLPAIFAAPLSSNIAKKLGGFHNSMLLCFLISAAYCCVIPFITNIYLYYVAQFVFGFARGCATSLMMAAAILNIDRSKRGSAMGFFQAIYGIGMTLGPQVVGLFGKSAAGETNLPGLMIGFFFVAATQLIGGVLAMTVLKKQAAKAEM